MFTIQFGVLCIFLLCCCNKSEGGNLFLKNRAIVSLVGRMVTHQLEVTIPANSTKTNIICYKNNHKIWDESVGPNPTHTEIKKSLQANINMTNISYSGEYHFKYMNEKVYWVVLVRDMDFQQNKVNFVTPLLVVITLLLLFSITGSVYIFKWYKNYSSSDGDGDDLKPKKGKKNTVVKEEAAKSDSVYTALEQRTVSVYDVLTVDEARRPSTEDQRSKKKDYTSPTEEGIFESVYENL